MYLLVSTEYSRNPALIRASQSLSRTGPLFGSLLSQAVANLSPCDEQSGRPRQAITGRGRGLTPPLITLTLAQRGQPKPRHSGCGIAQSDGLALLTPHVWLVWRWAAGCERSSSSALGQNRAGQARQGALPPMRENGHLPEGKLGRASGER